MKTFVLLTTVIFLNFCTLKPPPITFTQSQTAAERQMIGEDKSLERDGWIISSIRTSASGSEIWDKEVLDEEIPEEEMDREIYNALRTISYFSGEIMDYKKKGYIGEGIDGFVKINPQVKSTRNYKKFTENKKRITDLISLVNQSRKEIFDKKISLLKDKKLKGKKLDKEILNVKQVYYNIVEDGEFYEIKKGKWGRKD
ncbi:MAG: DUF1318 domain-containing protein [Leptospiraceae bacterium]|nr:DUF1318 domain-containing protein [Leptospiraceae bacterium]MCP5495664.1 DUF1318 domain-containing protein [Leptospiraceae bacterium]